MLGADINDEKKWPGAISKAKRYIDLAEPKASAQKSDYFDIDELIKKGAIGRVQNEDSLFKNRIRPRVPSRKEVESARSYFHPESGDTEQQVLAKALEAAAKASSLKTRHPAIVFNLLGHSMDYETILETKKLQWEAYSPFWLVQRSIIEPINAPTIEDLNIQIDAYLGDFVHRLSMRQ
jgi:hypothetical protein